MTVSFLCLTFAHCGQNQGRSPCRMTVNARHDRIVGPVETILKLHQDLSKAEMPCGVAASKLAVFLLPSVQAVSRGHRLSAFTSPI